MINNPMAGTPKDEIVTEFVRNENITFGPPTIIETSRPVKQVIALVAKSRDSAFGWPLVYSTGYVNAAYFQRYSGGPSSFTVTVVDGKIQVDNIPIPADNTTATGFSNTVTAVYIPE